MKKLILLFALSFSLTSCLAQKVELLKPIFPKGEMTVLSIVGNSATLVTDNGAHSFIVDAPEDLVQEWEYYFVLEATQDSKGKRTRPATIKFYAITPVQANKNIAKGLKDFQTANPE
jgi:hypothetical protein